MFASVYNKFFAMLFVGMFILPAVLASPIDSASPAAAEDESVLTPQAKFCFITKKKSARDCNASSCRAGGGACVLNKRTNRCNQNARFKQVIECRTNCACAAGNI